VPQTHSFSLFSSHLCPCFPFLSSFSINVTACLYYVKKKKSLVTLKYQLLASLRAYLVCDVGRVVCTYYTNDHKHMDYIHGCTITTFFFSLLAAASSRVFAFFPAAPSYTHQLVWSWVHHHPRHPSVNPSYGSALPSASCAAAFPRHRIAFPPPNCQRRYLALGLDLRRPGRALPCLSSCPCPLLAWALHTDWLSPRPMPHVRERQLVEADRPLARSRYPPKLPNTLHLTRPQGTAIVR
jgi:hypothetical protein